MGSEDVAYTVEYQLLERTEVLPFAATRVGLEGVRLSEISQTKK